MSMYNDIDWGQKCNKNKSSDVAEYARKFPTGHWSFLGHGFEGKWYATLAHKSDGFVEQGRRRHVYHICRKRASCIQGNERFMQRTSEKQRWWKNIDTLQRGTDDWRAIFYASLSPSVSSVSTEPYRVGAKILLSKSQLILRPAR